MSDAVKEPKQKKTFFAPEDDNSSLVDVINKVVDQPSGIFEHLNDLRKRLMWAVLGLAVTTVFSFIFTPRIIDFLALPIGGINKLQAIDVTEPISVFMRVALLSGFALGLPWVALQLWLYAAPGLTKKEALSSLFSIPAVAVFFIGGMVFAYYIMLPTALPFLLNFMGMNTIPRPSSYIDFVTSLLFWIGISFEFPLVIYVLAMVGFVKPKMLLDQWRLAVVIIAVVAAIVTPTVDPVNMSLVMAPMIVLYFISIGLAAIAARGRREKEAVTSNQKSVG